MDGVDEKHMNIKWSFWRCTAIENLYGVGVIYREVNWGLNWNFSVDNDFNKESSRCRSGFCGDFKLGGIVFEARNDGSFNVLYFLFGAWDGSGVEIVEFSVFFSVLTTENFGDFILVGFIFSVSFRSSKISAKDDFEVDAEFILSVG